MNIRKQLLYVAITIGFIATHEKAQAVTYHRHFYNATMANVDITVHLMLGGSKTFSIPPQSSYDMRTHVLYTITKINVTIRPQQIGGVQYVGAIKTGKVDLTFNPDTLGATSAAFAIFGPVEGKYYFSKIRGSDNLISAELAY